MFTRVASLSESAAVVPELRVKLRVVPAIVRTGLAVVPRVIAVRVRLASTSPETASVSVPPLGLASVRLITPLCGPRAVPVQLNVNLVVAVLFFAKVPLVGFTVSAVPPDSVYASAKLPAVPMVMVPLPTAALLAIERKSVMLPVDASDKWLGYTGAGGVGPATAQPATITTANATTKEAKMLLRVIAVTAF
jgi:hypothetical protein